MDYKNHNMEIILFDEACVFTVNDGSDNESSSTFDFKPDRSDA